MIGTTLAAQADFIVTGDKSLLSVTTYQGGHIIGVSEAVRTITAG